MDDPFQFATNNALSPGQVFLERYTLVKFLGRGGMGQVWLVKDSLLGEEIALKFLPSEIMADRAALEDLKRETMRSRKLSHPQIIKVYDFTTAHNSGAISMEYVSGGTLADVRYDLPGAVMDATDPRFAAWMVQLAEALAYAHESVGIVHRDLKPQNLMLDCQGNLKLADFGVSRSLTDSMSRLSRQNAGSSGTHIYMSPQQAQGNAPAVADDIYAFGATVYDLLTGKPPFFRGNIQHQIDTVEPDSMNHRRAELVEDAELPPIPQYWEDMVAACLKKLPEQRPAIMREIRDYLVNWSQQSVQTGPPPSSALDQTAAENARLAVEARSREETERQERERQTNEAIRIREHETARKQSEERQHQREQDAAREHEGEKMEFVPSKKPKPLLWIIATCVVLGIVVAARFFSNDNLAQVASPSPISSNMQPDRAAPSVPIQSDSNVPISVKEYDYKPSEKLPSITQTSGYEPMNARTVKFALNVWAGWAPLILQNGGAEPGKLWTTPSGEPFKVELVLIDNPISMRDAYAAGMVHIGWATLDMLPLFMDQLKKDPRIMPRVFQQVDFSNGGDGIVIRRAAANDPKSPTISDLKGKKVVLAQNSPSEYFLLNALVNGGVQPSEVDFVYTEDAFQAAAAFNADKTIAACVSWAPDIYTLSEIKGNHMLVSTATANKLIADVWFARGDFARDHMDICEGLVRGIFEGMAKMENDEGKRLAASLMSKLYSIPEADTLRILGDAHSTNYAENRAFFMNQNNPANFERIWNTAYLLYRKKTSITQAIPFDQVMDFSILQKLGEEEPYR